MHYNYLNYLNSSILTRNLSLIAMKYKGDNGPESSKGETVISPYLWNHNSTGFYCTERNDNLKSKRLNFMFSYAAFWDIGSTLK